MAITSRQRYLLSAETGVDPRTIVGIYKGKPSKPSTRERVLEAAKKLHLPKPPEPEKIEVSK